MWPPQDNVCPDDNNSFRWQRRERRNSCAFIFSKYMLAWHSNKEPEIYVFYHKIHKGKTGFKSVDVILFIFPVIIRLKLLCWKPYLSLIGSKSLLGGLMTILQRWQNLTSRCRRYLLYSSLHPKSSGSTLCLVVTTTLTGRLVWESLIYL